MSTFTKNIGMRGGIYLVAPMLPTYKNSGTHSAQTEVTMKKKMY